ncbi:MAG: phosphatase PAP2 family protein [Bacteroidetes bacterium]|nr:phosphatase PAP2 family protein [Bacteroidota bacterium]
MKKLLPLLLCLSLGSSSFSQNLDIDLLRAINVTRNKNLDGTFLFITNSVTPVTVSAPLIVTGIGLLKKDSLLTRKGLYLCSAFLVAGGITTILKQSINRERPFYTYPDIQKVAGGGSPSFPSGHTSAAFATATSLSLAFPKWYVIAPSFAYAGAMGYSRMHLGVHYPTDVLAGWMAGCSGLGPDKDYRRA